MRNRTTFKIGGPAEVWFEPHDLEDLRSGLLFCKKERLKPLVIGGGSNLLVMDDGLGGLVISLNSSAFKGLQFEDGLANVGAGASLASLTRGCLEEGLAGCEFLTGIPGTVGGGLVMNAGVGMGSDPAAIPSLRAKRSNLKPSGDCAACCEPVFEIASAPSALRNDGRSNRPSPPRNDGCKEGLTPTCFGDIVEEVTMMDFEGEEEILKKDRLKFRYRSSNLPDGIIISCKLRLRMYNKVKIGRRMRDFMEYKKKTQELNRPSAGCIFKNPSGVRESAGELIESSGLKGARIGGARVCAKHANFIINAGEAKATDVLSLIKKIQEKVRRDRNVRLETEIRIVG